MNRKSILIVEDDVFIAEQLNAILTDLGYEIVGMATSSELAIKIIKETPPDLALLDIRMHGLKQGFSVANYLNETNKIPFIFVTSFADKDTVLEASTLRPMAYILKPFNSHNLFSTLEIAFAKIQNSPAQLTLNSDLGKFKISFKDILWIKADDKYLVIQTVDRNYLYRSTLNDIMNLLDSYMFCRVHRSYIVNLNLITMFKRNCVSIGKIEIPVSRTYLPEFKMKFERS
ncbi:MAG: DNA-binding LytR/AlgR family response regulator [Crocinitomicaceae bacterium]|jgi:DNA-binding LytR/AlgR family response regulator